MENKVYINLTNGCTNDCLFCVRRIKDDVVGADMWLETENITASDVIEQLEKYQDKLPNGLTFCGYGEPTIKFDILKEVAEYIKRKYPDTYIKINTNGHGNAINKKNILPELKGLIDEISISLNAQNEDLYNKLCLPKVDNAYAEMLEFAKTSVQEGFKTTMSIVSGYQNYDVDIDKCEKITQDIGAVFRNREWLDSGY
ncbi:MAG: TatD family nuclease-associated radical SAM protein [Candidatus Gastranaerophilales bacterium]|nr:TatD family nuclease-associated radical SAM protein [Candidatus Gastranaerophilales bacterium]